MRTEVSRGRSTEPRRPMETERAEGTRASTCPASLAMSSPQGANHRRVVNHPRRRTGFNGLGPGLGQCLKTRAQPPSGRVGHGSFQFRAMFVFPFATRFLWWCHKISTVLNWTADPSQNRTCAVNASGSQPSRLTRDYYRSLAIAIRSVSFRGDAKGKRFMYAWN